MMEYSDHTNTDASGEVNYSYRDFVMKRAHVVMCKDGGYGVMEFGNDLRQAIVHHGYSKEGTIPGRLSADEARRLADELNQRVRHAPQ